MLKKNLKPHEFSDVRNTLSVDDMAKKAGVAPDRLRELCAAGFIPHHRVDGGEPRFRTGETMQWVRDNLLQSWEGVPLPRYAAVWTSEDALKPAACAPVCLRGLENLHPLAMPPRLSGIYFLCRNDVVVYVGQSTDVYSRVPAHRGVKDFDVVYFWPVPPSDLDRVEGAFIRLIKPCLNGNVGPVTDEETRRRIMNLIEVAA